MALSPDGSVLYVTTVTGHAVEAIDTESLAMITYVGDPSVEYYSRGIAVSSDGGTLYFSAAGSDDVIAASVVQGSPPVSS